MTVMILYTTNKLAEADPLMRRNVEVLCRFNETTGHEHLNLRASLSNCRDLLTDMELSGEEIDRRLRRFV